MKHKHHSHSPAADEHPAAPAPEPQPPDAAAAAELPPLTPEDIAALQAKAATADEWHTKYLYAAAETDNARKRAAKERQELLRYAGKEILYHLLDICDNFSRALAADEKESDPKVIVRGIEIIYKQVLALLDKSEVRRIPAKGSKFDPAIHEAIQQVPTADAAPGTVLEELQAGYHFRDRVLRPARVVIAAAPPDNNSAECGVRSAE